MEEKEALKRQIELLQNLINNHKSVHGNTPFTRTDHPHPARPVLARGRGQNTTFFHPHSSRGRLCAPHPHGNWRKTYSLSNTTPQPTIGQPSASTSSSVALPSPVKARGVSHSTSLPSDSQRGEANKTKTATLSSQIAPGEKEERLSNIRIVATGRASTDILGKTGKGAPESGREDGRRGSSLTGSNVRQEGPVIQTPAFQQKAEGRNVVLLAKKNSASLPSSVTTSASMSVQSSSQLQVKPCIPGKTNTESKPRVVITTTANVTGSSATPPVSALSNASQTFSCNLKSYTSPAQVSTSTLKQSKFTWVKNQNTGAAGSTQDRFVTQASGKSVSAASTSLSNAGVAGGSSPSSITSRRTPVKKLPRRLSLVIGAPRTSKYTWVSSTAGGQAKLSRKPLSPRSLAVTQRALEKGDATKKFRPASAQSTKMRKGIAASSSCSTSSSLSSRYRWKAGGHSASGAVAGGVTVARRGSAFHWTSEKNNKSVKGGFGVSPSTPQRASVQPSPSPGGFKLRSRMKIIRRAASSETVSERVTSPPAVMVSSKYTLRRRIHTLARSPTSVRKTPSKELVSFGRHKLRRLSPTYFRTGITCPSHRSPTSQRVLRTRYKMVTRLGAGTAHTLHYSPSLSWRAKRIQSARTLLQSRMRAPQERHMPPQHWRGKRSMRWIGGSLYRVSANKLSRTVATSMSINRTGRWLSPQQVSLMSMPSGRPSNTRHVASRAVQRSLAIIRHARQKKQQKQYCMYYNRFGKCNRGSTCPYIHDPDKVAVCTRFLRGTCKQADGTCPFSHKVAKEKMPVCSYFLKGICNNSSCPYSHVYVSRKADVCQDFIKGYCPQGEKCKKKHTLVCPEFSKTGSCPRGPRCKLQHRQNSKRSTPATPTPAKKGRTKESNKRPRLSVIIPPEQAPGSEAVPGTPTSDPLKLPSFISLSSSPEEADAPDTLPAKTLQVKEKKLQIKPRL
ncbi:zinc finger CCCH domain-containing protein 3 isoform X2 [Myripristis murdjan]|uniref:Zinc finger CCCH domain-containing protein 3 n=1 Tax=Myripristis murdjan TaxID=586833 RepID=A0A667YKL7_9TELE|nr:zinc finger CCCH domain-containing protein 3 isoform X2 [Myripristis murdjan]